MGLAAPAHAQVAPNPGLGADLGERNLVGTGLAVGGGIVYADNSSDVVGARPQWAGEVRVADPGVLGTAYGIDGSFTTVHGSEPFRVGGAGDTAADFHAFS